MHVPGLVTVVVGILGLIAVVAAAAAVARASYVRAQVEGLRGDRDDLQARVAIVEADNERLKRAVADERGKREALELVVTGREQLDHIAQLLEARTTLFADLQHHMDRIEAGVNELRDRFPDD